MPKRGENIRKRKDGRWEARYVTEDGKRKSIYSKSYSDLKQKLRTDAEEKAPTEPVVKTHENTSFIKICELWLAEKEIKNKRSTIARYRAITYNHLIPYFSDRPISRDNINAFILDKSNTGHLQEKTVYDIVTVLMQIVKYGINMGLLQDFSYVISRPTIHKKELEILTEDEQKKLVNYIKQAVTCENIGILLSLYSGLRIGEICALKWQDIDIHSGTISITRTMQRIPVADENSENRTTIVTDVPKSQKSLRIIPIPEFLKTELERLSKNCPPTAYVLTASETKYTEPRTYQYKFKKTLEQAEIRNINFHALRHTFATRAIEQDIDVKVLSEILGHATINFTLERYVHISLNFKKQNIEKLNVCY